MTLRVLLVDDHRLMREGLRKILEGTPGIQVVGEAEDGHSALVAAAASRPDVVVMDVGMKGMNGIEATQRLRKEQPTVRVVALSTHADKRYVRNMIRAGAAAYVLKESASDDLLRAVQAASRGEHYLSPRITGSLLESWSVPSGGESSSAFELLGAREREVLKLMAEGKTSKEIGARLDLAVKTIETHRRNIAQKVGLHSVAELTKYAVREGLTTLE
ncbi:MAG: response regulator transcription factor [Planctomycetes bacterium]|nr:response regulator transcription factor [Planctomycetota bacterium]